MYSNYNYRQSSESAGISPSAGPLAQMIVRDTFGSNVESGLDADHVGCSTAVFFEEAVDGWEGERREVGRGIRSGPLNSTFTHT